METKEKMSKWDYIELTRFHAAKKVNKTKTTCWIQEDISQWYIPTGVNIQNVFKNSYNLTRKNNLIKKWAEDLNRHFSKEDIQMTNRHMKICSTSQIIRETQFKTTMRCHLTPVRMAVIINQQTTNVGEDMEKKEPSCTVGRKANWCSHCGKQYGVSSKN